MNKNSLFLKFCIVKGTNSIPIFNQFCLDKYRDSDKILFQGLCQLEDCHIVVSICYYVMLIANYERPLSIY